MIRRMSITGAVLLLAAVAIADDAPRVLIPCAVTAVHDGDTIIVDVLFPWSVSLRDQTVRMQGVDCWEITRTRQTVEITDDELAKGKIARDALQGLLDGAETVYLEPGEHRDPYGRLPAYVHVWDGKTLVDVAKWLTKRGHARK